MKFSDLKAPTQRVRMVKFEEINFPEGDFDITEEVSQNSGNTYYSCPVIFPDTGEIGKLNMPAYVVDNGIMFQMVQQNRDTGLPVLCGWVESSGKTVFVYPK